MGRPEILPRILATGDLEHSDGSKKKDLVALIPQYLNFMRLRQDTEAAGTEATGLATLSLCSNEIDGSSVWRPAMAEAAASLAAVTQVLFQAMYYHYP